MIMSDPVIDMFPVYITLGLLIMAVIGQWVWGLIISKWPVKNWLCADEPKPVSQQLVGRTIIVPKGVFCRDNPSEEQSGLVFTKIPGSARPGEAEKLVRRFHKKWGSPEFIRAVVDDIQQRPTPLPEFLVVWSDEKNNQETGKAMDEIYGRGIRGIR